MSAAAHAAAGPWAAPADVPGEAELRDWWTGEQPRALREAALSGPGEGRVRAALDALEQMGHDGAPPGWCYALASQVFGVQMPLAQVLGDRAGSLLDGVADGHRLMCHALTEEGGGSDPLSMATTARRVDGAWEITGRKAFVTAAPIADLALLFARTDPESHPFALTGFLVDLHGPGVHRHPPLDKRVLTEVPMGVLDLEGVRVPDDHVVGEEGSGLGLLTATTTWERGLLPGYAVGEMCRVLDRTVAWARDRTQFGRAVGASHLAAGRVADMAACRLRVRSLVRAIAARLDDGEAPRTLATDASLVKLSAAEDLLAFSRHASALGGVRSFVAGSGLTTDPATAVAASTYAGPDDLLRVGVARALGLPVQN